MATRPWDQPRASDKDNSPSVALDSTKTKSIIGVDPISKPKPEGVIKGENVDSHQRNDTATELESSKGVEPLAMTIKRKPPPIIPRLASPRGPKTRDLDEALEVSTARSSTRSVYSMGVGGGPKFHLHSLKMKKAGTSIATDDESFLGSPSVPNYMSATQSAKAKARSLSNPKQRPGTPDKEQSFLAAKKRLSCPITEGSVMSSISQTTSNGH